MFEIRVGHVLDVLRDMASGAVQCVVTSPPYWGLRDYGLPPIVWGGDSECEHEWGEGRLTPRRPQQDSCGGVGRAGSRGTQSWAKSAGKILSRGRTCRKCNAWRGSLGLEPVHDCLGWATGQPCGACYVCHLVEVFREVWRVLRVDGTLWLNLGDSYYTQPAGNKADKPSGFQQKSKGGQVGALAQYGTLKRMPKLDGLKPKDLVGIPWRVALALQADGWYLRSAIVWAKGLSFCPEYSGSVMPESVKDRPTSACEMVFLLSKNTRYFYDVDAVREPLVCPDALNRPTPAVFGGTNKHSGYNTRKHSGNEYINNPGGRNLRNVWAINPQPWPSSHFAVFPEALVEPMILAGTSARGACPKCGAAWKRVVERTAGKSTECPKTQAAHEARGGIGKPVGTVGKSGGSRINGSMQTIGWQPTCDCDAGDPVPQTVLDPFAGAGTTGIVACRLGHRFVGIELNPEYAEMARHRYDKTYEVEVGVDGQSVVFEQTRLIG